MKEPQAILEYENVVRELVVDRQKKVCIQLKTDTGTCFEIIGSIDGMCNGDVLEFKCRSSPLKKIPEWERIQLATYCFILKKAGKLLVFLNGEFEVLDMDLDMATKIFKRQLPLLFPKIDYIEKNVRHHIQAYATKRRSNEDCLV